MSEKLSLAKSDSSDAKPWYHKGLRFQCTECGQCCTGSPGYVWVSDEEIASIAEYLKLSIETFAARYLRKVDDRYSLLEKQRGKEYDCVFLQGKKCMVYPVRPKQCRTFPWWPGNVSSPEAWQSAASTCEGIRPDAPIVPFETIEKARKQHDK